MTLCTNAAVNQYEPPSDLQRREGARNLEKPLRGAQRSSAKIMRLFQLSLPRYK